MRDNGNSLNSDVWELPPAEVIFGQTRLMAIAREKLSKVADTTLPVLLQGASGTGKDVFARLLHLQSRRSRFPWVRVSCPAIPPTLLESELFGYEKGAFTGAHNTKPGRIEHAHQGTLFLDEVSSLEIGVQAKLLQVLQDGTLNRVGGQASRRVDARLICASDSDLRKETDEGNFRLDFLFRINTVIIDLPSLRQRITDLPSLIDYFLDKYARTYRSRPKPLSRELLTMMAKFQWPGNIRQLENMIRSYVLVGDEESLASEMIPPEAASPIPDIDLAHPVSLKEITRKATQNLERNIILKVLEMNGWSRRKTAKWLGISYRSLLYKLQEIQTGTLPSGRVAQLISNHEEFAERTDFSVKPSGSPSDEDDTLSEAAPVFA